MIGGSNARMPHSHAGAARLAMGRAALACGMAGLALLAGCVPPPAVPAPTPAPAPPPAAPLPAAPTPAAPAPQNWIDAPQTPGDWSYTPSPAGGTALFGLPGAPVLTLRCDRNGGAVEIMRPGAAANGMRILTEFGVQAVQTSPAQGGAVARINAQDRLLDSMAFSKGRFGVETGGQPTLYIPAWPEVTRVIEDCR